MPFTAKSHSSAPHFFEDRFPRILTDETIVARHVLPSLRRFDGVVEIHGVVGLEAAGRREGRDLNLNPLVVILTFAALPLLVLMSLLFGA